MKENAAPEVLFLDIELPDKNGVEVGRYIREELLNSGIHIIYISARSNYAMELFQVHPYDFLIKPVTQDNIDRLLTKLLLADEQDKRFYIYTYRKTKHKVPFGKIQYMSSYNKQIELHMDDGSRIKFTGKLKAEAEKLPPQFVIIGQSYIVNLKYVTGCAYDHVLMQNGERINISQPNRPLFRERLFEFNGGTK